MSKSSIPLSYTQNPKTPKPQNPESSFVVVGVLLGLLDVF